MAFGSSNHSVPATESAKRRSFGEAGHRDYDERPRTRTGRHKFQNDKETRGTLAKHSARKADGTTYQQRPKANRISGARNRRDWGTKRPDRRAFAEQQKVPGVSIAARRKGPTWPKLRSAISRSILDRSIRRRTGCCASSWNSTVR